MLVTKPDFYDAFKCIANKCTDSCCIGWEIVVDSATREKYENIKSAFGEKIRENLIKDEDNEICFKLDENERCPFLNKNNLCDIIINCGEEALCSICTEHPRFYNDFEEALECGVGLCCEEACRLLLETEKSVRYITESDSDDEAFSLDDGDYIEIFNLRAEMFAILEGNEALCEKILLIKELIEKATNEKISLSTDEEILETYEKTEPINNEWTEYFHSLKNNASYYLEKEKPFDETTNGDSLYSKILSYIIFRHLSSFAYDNIHFGSCFNFCASAVRFIKLCDMKTFFETNSLTLKDRIENVKRWSKQIEYSDLNVEKLTCIK